MLPSLPIAAAAAAAALGLRGNDKTTSLESATATIPVAAASENSLLLPKSSRTGNPQSESVAATNAHHSGFSFSGSDSTSAASTLVNWIVASLMNSGLCSKQRTLIFCCLAVCSARNHV